MAQGSNGRRELDDLPASNDPYFRDYGADVNVYDKLKDPPKCDHHFIRIGHDVECKNCHIGYEGFTGRIVDGHLYSEDKLIV